MDLHTPPGIFHSVIISLLGLLACCAGCAQTRQITISTEPPDANIRVNGQDRGRAPVIERFSFSSAMDTHRVTATRPGYREKSVTVTRDDTPEDLHIPLEPQTRRVVFNVTPVPAIVSLDGKPLSADPVSQIGADLPFPADPKMSLNAYRVKAEREGYESVELTITGANLQPTYELNLAPKRKDVVISTTPPGAQITIDGEPFGTSPVTTGYAFEIDPESGEFEPHTVRATKPGYDPAEITMSWDEGRAEYSIQLGVKSKVVRIMTEPLDATVQVEGADVKPGADGARSARLLFPPVNEKGELRRYKAVATKKTAEAEYQPHEFTIGWDDGQIDYTITLEEIRTRPVELMRVQPVRTEDGWTMEAERVDTLAMKDAIEPEADTPEPVVAPRPGTVIDSLAVSPDAAQVAYAVLAGDEKGPTARIFVTAVERNKAEVEPKALTDGKSLDLMPSFTPDGTQIVFSSNRIGRNLTIWSMSATGEPGVTQLTDDDSTDLWPAVDSAPKPRLFYQAMVDTRADARLFMKPLGDTGRTDLTPSGGMQPRIGPKADSVVFTAVNETTGKRDIFTMADRRGVPVNLTNSPDVDEFDAAWSRDGRRIAFVSDRVGIDARATAGAGVPEDHKDYNLWVLDIARPGEPTQVTANLSWDDCPAWDATGKKLYFRSNRGGGWGIWRIAVK